MLFRAPEKNGRIRREKNELGVWKYHLKLYNLNAKNHGAFH